MQATKKSDILAPCQVGVYAAALGYVANAPPKRDAPRMGRLPKEHDLAAVWHEYPSQQTEQGGFASPVWPQKPQAFAWPDFQTSLIQSKGAVPKAERDALKLSDGRRQSRCFCSSRWLSSGKWRLCSR
jgi:hypothetical protein